jgi:ribosomal protein L12E/L44/L45/RPP1/RPP2
MPDVNLVPLAPAHALVGNLSAREESDDDDDDEEEEKHHDDEEDEDGDDGYSE